MTVLRGIRSPEDLRALPTDQLPALAAEIRAELVEKVTRTGGHLGPNLGVVELTIALHRVFQSPRDVLVFDTGHQSYVHKMLTGRLEGFEHLKQAGLSGYPSRAESEHDVVENSHASTALSWADGIAKGFERTGELGRPPRGRDHRRRRAHRWHGLGGHQQHRGGTGPPASSWWSTTTGAPTPRRSAVWPTTSRPCARRTPTSGSSTGASPPWAARRSWDSPSTRRCTGSRRASRTSSRRRACSRTSA